MRYYELYVLTLTTESRKWEADNEFTHEHCPRDLMVKKPIVINAERIESFFQDVDDRITCVNLTSNDFSLIVMPFEKFKEMVFNKVYKEVI